MRVIRVLAIALTVGIGMGSTAMADGFKTCTKIDKGSWKPASEAEAKAKALGYEVRRSKIEGSCYEVYGVKEGKLYANDRPGLGVEVDLSQCKQILEVTKYDTNRAQTYFRPDGSITNW